MAESERSARVSSPALAFDWRSSEAQKLSDWQCELGNRSFLLHKLVLTGPRGSDFFKAAFNKEYDASSTKLSDLLPPPCHDHIEMALDFMYGHDIAPGPEAILCLFKIADILQIDALRSQMESTWDKTHVPPDDAKLIVLAWDLRLPNKMQDRLKRQARSAALLEALNSISRGLPCEGFVSGLTDLLGHRVQEADLIRSQSVKKLLADYPTDVAPRGILFKLSAGSVVKLPGWMKRCRLLVNKITGSGPTIGVCRVDANVAFASCPSGGFASRPGGWGWCLSDGKIFSNGRLVSDVTKASAGEIVSMDLQDRSLKIFRESEGSPLASIEVDTNDAVLTFCACCPNTEYVLLDVMDDIQF